MIYRFSGTVEGGHKLGRKLGFPTANIAFPDDTPISDGVYAARAVVDGKLYGAMVSVGRRPSVTNTGERVLEAHLFDFEGDLYGRVLEVELLEFMRPEERFPSKEALASAIARDRERILLYLENGSR